MSDGMLIAVERAESLRRRRVLTRRLLRVIPIVAGGLLVAAALIRLTHAPVTLFWALLGITVVGVAIFAWINGRVPPVNDTAAAQLDDDAQLHGELRSAHWFASQPGVAAPADIAAWTAFHLQGAAERVQAVSWPSVYPPVQVARTWVASTVMVLAAIGVILTSAWSSARAADGGRTAGGAAANATGPALPADLQKQIDELINAVQRGTMPMDVARAKASELREALAKLDPKMQDALAKAAQASQKAGDAKAGQKSDDAEAAALAARAEKAATEADLPQDMKWSMEDLAAKLAKASQRPSGTGEKEKASASDSKDGKPANAEQAKPGEMPDDASMQMTRTTAADAQSSQMMASSAAPMGANARGEIKPGDQKGTAAPLNLAALKKETVQADADSQGSNVLAEMRRKSEQSHSKMQFSRVAPLATYDKNHAAAPPPPPDTLRALVRQYFIRR